jgi:hypothetical protein
MPDVRLTCANCGSHVLVAPDEVVKKCGTCESFHLVPLDTAPDLYPSAPSAGPLLEPRTGLGYAR